MTTQVTVLEDTEKEQVVKVGEKVVTISKQEPIRKVVVLLSGGVKSATLVNYARWEGYEIYALTIDNGSNNQKEIEAAKALGKQAGVKEHVLMRYDVPRADKSLAIEDMFAFISFGMSYVKQIGAGCVYLGYSNEVDQKIMRAIAILNTTLSTKIELRFPFIPFTEHNPLAELIEVKG